MRFGPSRSTSFANRLAALAICWLLPAGAEALDCPASVAKIVDPAVLAQLSANIDGNSIGIATGDPSDDPRIILNRGEDIPSIIRHNTINPLGLPVAALAGAYIGDYAATSGHDFLNLPDDDRVLCLLVPGLELFLTDDVTHHYASVFSVDLAAGTVTLLDPWAMSSFLLPGRNLAGVEATATIRDGRQPLLTLKLSDLRLVLRGIVQWYFPAETQSAIETLFPGLAATPQYLAWKYGVILGSGSLDAGLPAALELEQIAAPAGNPDLSALARAGADLYPGVLSNFSNRTDGDAGFRTDIPIFAADLPFTVRWLLGRRLAEFGHRDLAVAFFRANVDAHPEDVDFRIALAEALADSGDIDGALTELAMAKARWRADVKAMVVADTEDEAVAYFLPHVKDTIAFELFQLRYQRMLLLDARLRFLAKGDRSGLDDVTDYFKRYGSSDFLAGFAAELLLTVHAMSDTADEAGLIDAMGQLDDPHQSDVAASAVFAHLTSRADIAASPELADALSSSPAFARKVCDNGADGSSVIQENETYRKSFDAFCAGAIPAEPRPSGAAPDKVPTP